MNKSIVLIIAEDDDAHALMVKENLRRHDCESLIIDISRFPIGQQASFTCGHLDLKTTTYLDGVNLADIRAIWWRRPKRCIVPNEYYLFDVDFVQTECDHFIEGLLWSTSCVWINHPTDEILASRKICQLNAATHVGLQVPRTIVTNSVNRAHEFLSEYGKAVITKRIGTARGLATETLLLSNEDLRRLQSIANCPTVLQEYIEPGGDVRVVVIGSELYAFWIDSANSANPVDYRFDLRVEHRPFQLPESQETLLRELFAVLGLSFGVVDLRVSPSGDYYFLEVNPSGQFGYLEDMTNIPLSDCLARLLARAAYGEVQQVRRTVL